MKNRARISLLAAPMLLLSLISTGCIVGRYYEGPNIIAEKVKDIKRRELAKQRKAHEPRHNDIQATIKNFLFI